jgi:ornithine carbamoyltransferase
VAPPEKGHHFLHIDDFSTDELRAMLASAAKARRIQRYPILKSRL